MEDIFSWPDVRLEADLYLSDEYWQVSNNALQLSKDVSEAELLGAILGEEHLIVVEHDLRPVLMPVAEV